MTRCSVNLLNPVFPLREDSAGIYIHVPFCLTRCHYCAFATNVYDEILAARYVNSVVDEMRLRFQDIPVDTIYLGGGTPSLLRPGDVEKLIQSCADCFTVAKDPEITVEMNPATVDGAGLEEFRAAGVTRISLGVQSFRDDELRAMGRLHTCSDSLAAFDDLRAAGFDNISLDLIAGYPGQSFEVLRRGLRTVAALGPEHVSIYLLEVKPGTNLQEQIRTGAMPEVDDDLCADMYEEICSHLKSTGYTQYEISNFSEKGRESLHNLKYWQDCVYIGLGAGAHGMTGRIRYANHEDLEEYMREIDRHRLPERTVTSLTPETRFKDALIMGLRLTRGLDLAALGDAYGVDARAFVMETLADLANEDLFVLVGNVLKLTPRGRLLSNIVFSRLL